MRNLLLLLFFIAPGAWAISTAPIECTTDPCESQPVTPPTPPIQGGKFVDCSLSAAGNGTYQTPWNRLANVVNMQTGNNLYLKEGTTCTPTGSFTVTWSGTAADPAVLGAYRIVAGQPVEGLSDYGDILNPESKDWGTRPKIVGSYVPSCRPGCSWSNDGTAQNPPAIPSNRNSGLVLITSATYVTVQDLVVQDAAAACVRVDAPGAGITNPTDNHIIYQRLVGYRCADAGLSILDSRNSIIRDSRVDLTSLEWVDGKFNSWPFGLGFTRGFNSYGLIENNTSTNGYGEAIGSYGTSFVVMRGNRAANNRRVVIYTSGTTDAVVEQNISVSSPVVDPNCNLAANNRCPGGAAYGTFPTSFANSQEEDGQPSMATGSIRVLFRNNLATAPTINGCYQFGNAQVDASIQQTGGWISGNTCIAPTGYALDMSNSMSPASGKVDAIAYFSNLLSGTCSSVTNALITKGFNYWPALPGDTDCRGTGDINGGAIGLPGTFNFATASATNFPSYSDFDTTGGVGANAGTLRGAIVLANAAWSAIKARFVWLSECQSAQASDSNWEKEAATDYCGNVRDSAPNIGAFQ